MQDSVFETVKSCISMRECAEMLGFSPSRSGFICCPFHGERTASLKLYTDNWHCYGCHAGGDVIEFFRKYKGYSRPIDAAKELATLAGLQLTQYKPIGAHSKPAVPPTPTTGQLIQAFKEWQKEAFYWLRKYKRWMEIIIIELSPKQGAEQLHPLFAECLRNKEFVDYALDTLAGGTDSEKLYLYKYFRKDVNEIVQRTHQIFRE